MYRPGTTNREFQISSARNLDVTARKIVQETRQTGKSLDVLFNGARLMTVNPGAQTETVLEDLKGHADQMKSGRHNTIL